MNLSCGTASEVVWRLGTVDLAHESLAAICGDTVLLCHKHVS